MIKFTSTLDFQYDVAPVEIVRDQKTLTKRASMLSMLKYAKTKNQTDLHIIALGAYEGTGFNRNGDAFLEKDCEDNCHYFKDSDRAVHRHHKNKPTDPKYGNIKAAGYNKAMKRIELIVGLDNDKCADILDEQEKNGSTNWSMASKQAHDVCSWCHHKARTDDERCEHIPMKLGELNQEGIKCGMFNPDPHWFEQSYVRRPADYIGMSLSKLASFDELKPMLPRDYLTIYKDMYVPSDSEFVISKKASDKRALLQKLAEMEKHIDGISFNGPQDSHDKHLAQVAHHMHNTPQLSPETIDELRKFKPDQLMKALADQGIVMKPDEYSSYMFGDRVKKENKDGMKTHLPHMHQELAESKDNEVVHNEKYEPSEGACLSGLPHHLHKTVSGLHQNHTQEGSPHLRQMIMMILEGKGAGEDAKIPQAPEQTKSAFDKELAKQYTAYKLAALNYLDEQGKLTDELCWNVLLQNRA